MRSIGPSEFWAHPHGPYHPISSAKRARANNKQLTNNAVLGDFVRSRWADLTPAQLELSGPPLSWPSLNQSAGMIEDRVSPRRDVRARLALVAWTLVAR